MKMPLERRGARRPWVGRPTTHDVGKYWWSDQVKKNTLQRELQVKAATYLYKSSLEDDYWLFQQVTPEGIRGP